MSKLKIIRILTILFIIVAFILPCVPAYAISSDLDIFWINSVYAYQDVLEDGDMFFIVDWTVLDDPLPTERTTETILLRFFDADGITEIKSTLPYVYFSNGYNRNVSSFYFSSSEVTLYSLVWEGPYTIRLDGNPTAAWTGGIPSASNSAFNWSVATTSSSTQLVIEARIRSLASALTYTWGNANISLLDTTATTGTVLTSQGETYFSNVIANLSLIAPNVLSAVSVEPEYLDRTYDDVAQDNIITDVTGTPFDLSNLAETLKPGLDPIVVTSLLGLAVLVYMVMKARDGTLSYKPMVLMSIPVIVILARLNWIPLWLIILLSCMSLGIIWYTFTYEKGSG